MVRTRISINTKDSISIILETIRVEFHLRNTLQVPLILSEVQILWKHSSIVWKRKASVSTDTNEEAKEFTNDTLTKQVNA